MKSAQHQLLRNRMRKTNGSEMPVRGVGIRERSRSGCNAPLLTANSLGCQLMRHVYKLSHLLVIKTMRVFAPVLSAQLHSSQFSTPLRLNERTFIIEQTEDLPRLQIENVPGIGRGPRPTVDGTAQRLDRG